MEKYHYQAMARKNVFEILKLSKKVTKKDFCDFAEEHGIKSLKTDMTWEEIEKEVRMDSRVDLSDIRNKWPDEFGMEIEEEEEVGEEGTEESEEKEEEVEAKEEEVEDEEVDLDEEGIKIIREEELEEEKGGFLDKIRNIFSGLIDKIFGKKDKFRLGIYGATNVGKTTLANRISKDWLGEEVGKASPIPHETRAVHQKENVKIEKNGRELNINLVDTPGISTKIDFEEFLDYDFEEGDAKKRAKEATKGVIEAIRWLDNMDVVLAVMDSTKDPLNQINLTILGNLEARGIPVIVVANKLDKNGANVERVEAAFPQYETVGISAKEGLKMDNLYETIFKVTK